MASEIPIQLETAAAIAAHLPTSDKRKNEFDIIQARHRINILNILKLKAGSHVLDVGCGQGLMTCALAHCLGPECHVQAIDPGPRDYGGPITLGQAHDHIDAGELGSRITWNQMDVHQFLAKNAEKWDAAILAHCIWYFPSRDALRDILAALKGRVQRVCIAEYSLQASLPSQLPHILTATTRALLESQRPDKRANIKSPFNPDIIKEVAKEAGWGVTEEQVITPDEELQDGFWEVKMVLDDHNRADMEKIEDKGVREAMWAARYSIEKMREEFERKGEKERTMDVWVGVLE